jgi:hypothetical protein
MTIGVHNDFRQSTAHSDELWFQGGGRLCYNVGSWDSELNTIIGTPGVGSSHGGVKHEWRVSNAERMTLDNSELKVVGNISTSGLMNMGDWAVGQGYMASRTLTLGSISSNYGGGNNWNANTAAILLECADNTEIAVHDAGNRVASLIHFEGGSTNRITIGRNMGWGTTITRFSGFVGINGRTPEFGYALDVSGFARAGVFQSSDGLYKVGAGNATVVKHGGILAMDQFTWRRVVPQRWTGDIVWTPVANDHSAMSIRVVMNSNTADGTRDMRVLSDYYCSGCVIESRWNGGWLEFRKANIQPSFNNPHWYHVTTYGAII